MTDMPSIASIIAEWESARNLHPFVGEGLSDMEFSKAWDSSASTYSCRSYSTIRDSVLSALDDRGLLDGTVLDIGCGPGTYAIPMSSKARHVIAADLNRGMLGRLERECAEKSIENITTVQCDCLEIDQSYACDLAFASLCPPMNSPEALLYMEELGDACAYVSSCAFSEGLETRIWRSLGKSYSYTGYNTEYPYRYLKAIGREPEMMLFSQRNLAKRTVEETVSRYISLISRYRNIEEWMRTAIEETVESEAVDGVVTSDNKVVMGLLMWTRP